MKKLLLLTPFILATFLASAQNRSKLYNVDNTHNARAVYALGENPQFPFLRGLSTPEAVANAMHSDANRRKYPKQFRELDNIMKDLGFENGAKDVQASDISAATVEPGTTGNMGNGGNTYAYSVMKTKKPQKAWKVTGSNGDQTVALMNTCGNAFYSSDYTGRKPKCENEVVNVSSQPKEITVTATQKVQKKIYVYYKKGCPCTDCGPGWSKSAYEDGRLSRPLLVKTVKTTVPTTYKVTTAGTGNALICKGKATEVTAGIVVEKEGGYTGYMPPKKEYIEVSKHEYKRLLKGKESMGDVMYRTAYAECKDCDDKFKYKEKEGDYKYKLKQKDDKSEFKEKY